MALYEHIYIARQDISSQQVEELTSMLSDVITQHDGKIGKAEYWGLRPLAYKIRKNRKGHYSLLNIDASPEAIAEMERQMSLNDDIIRFMTLRVDEHDEGASPLLRAREKREARRERDDYKRDEALSEEVEEEVEIEEIPSLDEAEPIEPVAEDSESEAPPETQEESQEENQTAEGDKQ